ncbi:MAG: oligosaccharide flippase family protein, partial [Dysosmobacter sp.]|nr:oligosaccharide flippase family protein [Dysosmobacter sp.]
NSFLTETSWKEVQSVAIRYWKFFATIPGAFFDNMCASLPPLLLTYFFGDAASGFYSLGHRILALPLSVVGNSVSQAFLPEAKEAHQRGTLRPLCLRTMSLLLQVSCVPFLLLALVAPALISFIFGSRWYVAGGYIKWMSAWLLIQFVYSSLSCIFTILERQQTYTVLNFFTLCIRFLSLVAGGIILKAPLAAIALCSLSGAAVSGFKCAYILHLAGVHPGETFSCFVQQLLHAILYAIPTLISLALIGQNMFSAVVAILSGCVFLLLEMKPILHSLQTIGNDKKN